MWIGDGTRHAAPEIPFPNLYVNMGGLTIKHVLALTPGGSMGMPGSAVRAGKFDQPGMNGMSGMKGMDGMKGMEHGDRAPDAGKTNHSGMASAPAMSHAGHDMSGMAHGKMPMVADRKGHAEPGMVSQEKPVASKSTWLGLLAADVSSKAPLAADGMSAERPGPPYDKLRRAAQARCF